MRGGILGKQREKRGGKVRRNEGVEVPKVSETRAGELGNWVTKERESM